MKRIHILLCTLCFATTTMAQLRADNVDSILSQMTIREKATLVVGGGWGSMFQGIGMPTLRRHTVPGAAGETRAIPRLGIPSIILSDGPAGIRVRENGHVCYPMGLALAATGDTLLVEEIGRAVGHEARLTGIHVMLSPGMNIIRNPLCGRSYEYYSEDPALSAAMARAMTRGMQQEGISATLKHYALNSQETDRMHNDVLVDSTTMHSIYLRNFHDALVAQPWAIMSSYNGVNGTPVQLNHYLLDTVLRQQWGYDGVVMTDWMFYNHVAERVAAGNDLIMPGMKSYISRIAHQAERDAKGKTNRSGLTEQRLNNAARHVLQLIANVTNPQHPSTYAYDPGLIRRAAARACVLLKNEDHTLPLAERDKSLHPWRVALYGSSAYHTIGGGTGSGYVNCSHITSIAEGLMDAGCLLDQSLKSGYNEWSMHKKNYIGIEGMSIVSNYMGRPALKERHIEEQDMAEQAGSNDIAIVVIGRQAGEGHDRSLEKDWYLNETEKQLIQNVCRTYHAVGKKVVVVLNISNIIEAQSWCNEPDAILCCWTAGQEVGHGVADVLTGVEAASGRLPVSWPERWEDLPSSANYPSKGSKAHYRTTRYEEGTQLGYRFYAEQDSIKPLWPYGFGLKY